MKTSEEFIQAVKDKNITFFALRDCSICGEDFGLKFIGEKIFMDTNCGCSYYNPNSCKETSFDYLSSIYNDNSNKKLFIDRADELFFKEDKK